MGWGGEHCINYPPLPPPQDFSLRVTGAGENVIQWTYCLHGFISHSWYHVISRDWEQPVYFEQEQSLFWCNTIHVDSNHDAVQPITTVVRLKARFSEGMKLKCKSPEDHKTYWTLPLWECNVGYECLCFKGLWGKFFVLTIVKKNVCQPFCFCICWGTMWKYIFDRGWGRGWEGGGKH